MNTINPQGLVLRMIWFALVSAIVLYVVVLQFQTGTGSENEGSTGGGPDKSFVQILGVVAIVNILISFLVRRFVTLKAARNPSPQSVGNIMTGSIISWAMADSVAIFGLVIGMTDGGFKVATMFFLAGFIAMVFHYPSYVPLKDRH